MSVDSKNQTRNQKWILDSEILLYQNPENAKPIWYYRFKNPTGKTTYIRKSSKTESEALATRTAINHYNDIQSKFRSGSDFAETTWHLIFDRFVDKIDGERSKELAHDYNNRYWSKFFGNTNRTKQKDFYRITDDTLELYWAWRVKYYKSEDDENYRFASKVKGKTAHTTLRTEAYLLKFFLVEAYRQNMIAMLPKIVMKWDKYKSSTYVLPENNRRGRFDDETYSVWRNWWSQTRTDLKKSRNTKYKLEGDKFNSEWKTSKDKRSIYNNRFNRYNIAMTYTLTITISNTGIRPVEITKLIWDDVRKFEDDDGNTYSYINIRQEVSKVNKRRDAVARDFEETYIRFQEFRSEWVKFWGREPRPNELVFPHAKADITKLEFQHYKLSKVKPHQSVRNLFLKLDKQSGISVYKQNVNGIEVPRTLYSFRSWFISQRLKNLMDAYTLARTCGTSIEMIERYYDVNANLQFRKEITKHLRVHEHRGDNQNDF